MSEIDKPKSLTEYYQSLFPEAGKPAIAEMVRLREEHDRTCQSYFGMYCAAMGIEPADFKGALSSDLVQDVANERNSLLGATRGITSSFPLVQETRVATYWKGQALLEAARAWRKKISIRGRAAMFSPEAINLVAAIDALDSEEGSS